MAEKILISIPEMETAISKYNSVKANKLAAIEAMNAAVKTLDESYDGPAATIFMNAFERLYNNLKNSEQIMAHAVETLEKVVADLRDTETTTVEGAFNAMLEEGPKPTL